jgi:hypothetical protein
MANWGYDGGGSVHVAGHLQAGGNLDISVRESLADDTIDTTGQITLDGDAIAGGDLILNNDTDMTASGATLEAGQDVIFANSAYPTEGYNGDSDELNGNHDLTIRAGAADGVDDGKIYAENTTITVTGSYLTLEQDVDLDLAYFLFGSQGNTDLTLISNNGSVTAVENGGNPENAADQWASVGATADAGITLSGDQGNITTKQLTSTTGDIDVNAKAAASQLLATEAIEATAGSVNLTADGGIDADGNITAGTDVHLNNYTVAADGVTLSAGQDVIVGDGTDDGTTLTGEGALTVEADRDIVLGGAVDAVGDLALTADADEADGSDMTAYGSLTSTGGSISISASDSTIYLYDNVDAAIDLLLNNNAWAADEVALVAGQDVILADEKTLTGEGAIAVEADRDIVLGGEVDAVGDLTLTADADEADGGDMTAYGSLVSTGGSIEVSAADETIYLNDDVIANDDIVLNNNAVFGSEDDQKVDAQSGTITANGWLQKDQSSLYLEAAGDISLADYVEAHSGGVSIISENGKIFTPSGLNDTLNVIVEGYSDQSEAIGVDLPYDDGKAAIVIMSSEDLKLGESAGLSAEGLYDAASVDDRAAVGFLDEPAEIDGLLRNEGDPIDVAIYLASVTGNVHVVSPVSIESEGTGAMVVDAYDTVTFGSLFVEESLEGIGWLEVCSRRTGSLNEAVVYGTLPYADGSGPEEGYVLRGENDLGINSAWVLDAILPLALPDFAQTPKDTPIVGLDILVNDDAGEFPPVTVTLDSPTSDQGGTLTVNPDGTVTYEPPADLSGLTFDQDGKATDTFTYSITDAGQVTSDPATVTITLTNNLPAPANDTATANQGTPVVIDVLSNDADSDTDPLGVSSFAYEGPGTVVLNDDGTFTYTPPSGFVGEDSFTYSVTDGFNSASGTVTIMVNPQQAAPLSFPAAPGLERVEFEISGCPALMVWTAAELGVDERMIQVGIANALASTRNIQPCDACAGLKQAATILQDAEGTHIAALAQVISQFASSTAPPTEEQMTSIANAIALNVGGENQYAAAGEYLDALAKYVGILNSEMGFSAEQSIQLATDKYVGPLAEGQNVGVAAYVTARLAALGGS